MTKPTNTANDMAINALGMLCLGSDITVQESQGAQEAVASESLPSRVSERARWEALGFIFGQPFDDDQLFCPVTMPAGWTKKRTEHSMWNDIIDAAGNKRGSFFYKAAFYDRDAFMHAPLTRYYVKQRLREQGKSVYESDIIMDVTDCVTSEVLHTVTRERTLASPDNDGDRRAWWEQHDAMESEARNEALAWLHTNKPGWDDPGNYWPA